MKIFVTGAEGFIGSHVTEALVKAGHEVLALAQYNSFDQRGWLPHIDVSVVGEFETILGDVRDGHQMDMLAKGCDAIIHLAALIAIPYSYVAPGSYIDTNVTGTLNILNAARRHDIDRVVHTSTSEVYGSAQFVPITEEHPLVGQSPYSASKIGADQLAYSFFASFGTPVVTIRPFNTYGPRQSMRAVIPTIVEQLARGTDEIKLGELTPTRDFNFVTDTAAGFLAALTSDKSIGEVINLGSGFEVSIGEVAEMAIEAFGSDAIVVNDSQRKRPRNSEVQRLWASNEKAKRLLDWAPEFGGRKGFAAGLTKTIEWFAEPANLAYYKSQGYVT